MKKSQLLTVMGLLTGAGVAIVSAGLINLLQLPDYTLAQAWTELWEQHQLFAWAMTLYCSIMITFDFWVIAGIITQTSEARKGIV